MRGQTLVASLIVIAIIAILAVVMLKGSGGGDMKAARADGRGQTLPGLVKAKAEDTTCQSNLNQLRQGIAVYETSNDGFPPRMDDTRLGANFYKCPMGGETYQYEPSTGKVFCPHLGHEKF